MVQRNRFFELRDRAWNWRSELESGNQSRDLPLPADAIANAIHRAVIALIS